MSFRNDGIRHEFRGVGGQAIPSSSTDKFISSTSSRILLSDSSSKRLFSSSDNYDMSVANTVLSGYTVFGHTAEGSANNNATLKTLSNPNRSVVLIYDKENGIATILLNEPKKANAMSEDVVKNFGEIVDFLSKVYSSNSPNDEISDLRSVILTGAGKSFCAGGDLKFLKDRVDNSEIEISNPKSNKQIMLGFYDAFLKIRKIPVPIIAAVNGNAIGAGLCIALGCDIRIANAEGKMGLTFVSLGLHPGMGSLFWLPNLVGHEWASRLLLTGDLINGRKAMEIGLVSEIVEPVFHAETDDKGRKKMDFQKSNDALLAKAQELAVRIGNQGSLAVRETVKTLRMNQSQNSVSLQQTLEREATAQQINYASKEMKDRVHDAINKIQKAKAKL